MPRAPRPRLTSDQVVAEAVALADNRRYAADDVLDACAVAWTAARRAAGLSRSLPDPPEVFSDVVRSAIHV